MLEIWFKTTFFLFIKFNFRRNKIKLHGSKTIFVFSLKDKLCFLIGFKLSIVYHSDALISSQDFYKDLFSTRRRLYIISDPMYNTYLNLILF